MVAVQIYPSLLYFEMWWDAIHTYQVLMACSIKRQKDAIPSDTSGKVNQGRNNAFNIKYVLIECVSSVSTYGLLVGGVLVRTYEEVNLKVG